MQLKLQQVVLDSASEFAGAESDRFHNFIKIGLTAMTSVSRVCVAFPQRHTAAAG